MPITLKCPCGKTLRVADEYAGRRVKCPVCNAVILARAPEPEPAFEVVEDEPQPLAAAKPRAKPRDDDDEDEGGSYKMTAAAKSPPPPKAKPTFRKRADEDEDEDDDDRPARRRRRSGAEEGAQAGRRLAFIVGGGFGLAIGVVLAYFGATGTGRNATKLLIFGVVIAIAGLVGLVQGITGNLPDPE